MRYFYMAATPEVDRSLVGAMGARFAAEFAFAIREQSLEAIDFAYDARRQQYESLPVLERLSRSCPADAVKLLAVTERDLCLPVLTFVYGHAQLDGRVAIVSLARLRQEFYGLTPNPQLLRERAWKEALHETGHLFGLVHCPDRECTMTLSTGVRQIDAKRGALCAACAGKFASRLKESRE
jgi:archaemetzincin